MYRQTKRAKEQREKWAQNCVTARARKRLANSEERPPMWEPPEVRRVIEITDYDTGTPIVRRMELRRSNRVDCYNCYIGGKLWKSRIGWSRVLEWIRKAHPRVHGST
jgi:hypothetical protein